jgi:hypothetical protein
MVQPVKFRMRDFVTFNVKAAEGGKLYLHECKDSKSETGFSLLTWVDATHAGLVNGNMRFYRPDMVQAGCHTWVDAKRSRKPVLVRHDADSDPLGRIVEAKYIDESYKYVAQYEKVKSLLFYDSISSKRLDLFKSVDWVYSTLQRRNRDYAGLGYISLGLNVTNPDAIAKIQRGEYATVSVGFQTDAAYCSVCHQNWSVDGKCEHRLGELVDDKRCFLISGNFDYEECSFVNFPADPFANVKKAEYINRAKDSLALRVFLLGRSFDEGSGLLRVTDSLPAECADMLEADIQVVSEDDEETDMELDAIRAEITSKELKPERAHELVAQLEGNADAKRLLTTLKAKITKNGWNADKTVLTKEDVETRIAGLSDTLIPLSPAARKAYLDRLEADAGALGLELPPVDLDEFIEETWDLAALPEEDQAFFNQGEDALYDLMWAAEDGADAVAPSQDGKLSGAERKKLKGSTFCGPNRSFPVNDCSHVTAAKRLLGRAKVSEATKSKIHACVDRKAKSMGCGGEKGEKKDAAPQVLTLTDASGAVLNLTDAKNGEAIVKHVDATRALHDKLEDDNEKSMFRSAMGACMEVLSAEGWLSYMKGRVTAKDEVLVNKLEYDSLHDGVEAYDAERKKLQDSNLALRKTNVALLKDQKRALATQIVMYSVLSGEVGFKGLSADQVKTEIEERTTRQLVSLQDALSDLIKKLEIAVPAEEKLVDGAPLAPKPVDDKTAIADSTDQPQESTPGSNETPRGDGVAVPVATLDDLRSMRKSASVATYRRLKNDSK